MTARLLLILFTFMPILFGASNTALAQQKTVKECRAEWQAQKAEYQAKGVTEAAYVKQCRSGATASPGAAPNASAPAEPSLAALKRDRLLLRA
ncbi:MAG: hypothetical protein JO166_23230 [Deltaproteobacteria bacterium]|nr:hypothetical protein [Deltaproteobacteria bacterium]